MSHETRKITRRLTLKSPLEKVWQAITDPVQMSQWFGDTADFELQKGHEGWLGWEQHGQFALRIEAVEPMTYFAWRWMRHPDEAFAESQSTLVEWHLTAQPDGGTELSLIESGFKTPESRADNVHGWQEELEHLQNHLAA